MVEIYVGLGSNVEPEHNLQAALTELRRAFGTLRCSAAYRSPPLGFVGADFLNAVVAFESAAHPEAVDAVLSSIEHAGGRRRNAARFGPRTLDLDLLLYGARVDPRTRLPRADVLAYPFVLAPLCELAPELKHPVTGESMAAAWQRMAATAPAVARNGALDVPSRPTSPRSGRRRPR